MLNIPVVTIAGIVRKDKNILIAYIFGSSAKTNGVEKPGDLDVAVLLRRPPTEMKRLEFINDLSNKIEKTLKIPVDIVILNTAPVALCQQVLKYGKVVFERKKGLVKALVVDTITRYLEYLQILNFFYSRVGNRRGGNYG